VLAISGTLLVDEEIEVVVECDLCDFVVVDVVVDEVEGEKEVVGVVDVVEELEDNDEVEAETTVVLVEETVAVIVVVVVLPKIVVVVLDGEVLLEERELVDDTLVDDEVLDDELLDEKLLELTEEIEVVFSDEVDKEIGDVEESVELSDEPIANEEEEFIEASVVELTG